MAVAPSPPQKLHLLLFCFLLAHIFSHIPASTATHLTSASNTITLEELISDPESDFWPHSSTSDEEDGRRSLLWGNLHYYISYAALSANRIPCPPRSGRSYYTYNCYKTSGPVRPYYRGCSAITRCRK